MSGYQLEKVKVEGDLESPQVVAGSTERSQPLPGAIDKALEILKGSR